MEKYNTLFENNIYSFWEKNGFFKPNKNLNQDSFCIVTPPPNITGSLHIGHAFQQTIMDINIRYQRMQGKNTLWQTGTDHAGIATQVMIERKIMFEEKKTRNNYTRQDYIDKIWKWKLESNNIISQQMRRLGNSIDWERERFTMDEAASKAVKEAFIRLYNENLIYRGKRLVNWDPYLHTAISDLEVENKKTIGYIWYLRYMLADGVKTLNGKNYLVIATTRPETILGDSGVAVNPNDLRYKNLIGKEIILPIVNRRVPIVGDEYADINKNTGCVKITPAHDFDDYKVGKRQKLAIINIMDLNCNIAKEAKVFNFNGKELRSYDCKIPKKYHGIERFNARKKIIDELKYIGAVVDVKSHETIISYNDRSGSIIEPILTDQWYLRSDILAQKAIEAVKDGKIKFVSYQYKNMYFSWMNNIQDWCISRQLWWGHRIPAWYDEKGNIYVNYNESKVRYDNNLNKDIILHQDNDVLDTWFSSGLWTFLSLGWPENTYELKTFHPTNLLISGFDIIFFWIARMIMLTMYFIKNKKNESQIPFKIIYMTGLVRDKEGQKMSKSKGNVVDPIDIIDGISLEDLIKKRTNNISNPKFFKKIIKNTKKEFPNGIEPHGADALRFTLTSLASKGRDINLDMNRLSGYRNFCNKLWNASRFVLMNYTNENNIKTDEKRNILLADNWIKALFNETVKNFRNAIDTYRYDIAANILYNFTWNEFCDWYITISKPIIHQKNDTQAYLTRYTLISILEQLLRLCHPIIPFITENIWQNIKIVKNINTDTIMLQTFPKFDKTKTNDQAIKDLEWIKEVITAIRNIRAEMNIKPNKLLHVIVRNASENKSNLITNNENIILYTGNLKNISFLQKNEKYPVSIVKLISNAELLFPISINNINIEIELNRLDKILFKLKKEIELIKIKLSNKDFLSKAPLDLVEKERKHLKSKIESKIKIENQKTELYSFDL
ncbi:Valine--tRNA ligase [Candidatus Providencia siddallii]|uniref:Valine--tRNA ligase n=1 Tax=Candidatus Providencia siddallii TaxID=1715285 RepID=A0A0M6W840_9GAMM|nr:Valine--tRNA ligase [Candidatus Providencia siddallii]